MTPGIPERRCSERHSLKIPLSIRIWGTSGPAQRAQSIDLSARGVLMETDADLVIGAVVELCLKFPEKVTGQPTMEWRCKARVVRNSSKQVPSDRSRVGLHFDRLDVLR
jgi:hypothetical protein